ncbi:MAG: LysR family transcriptional regulator, partial [Burkholderiales bacterium]
MVARPAPSAARAAGLDAPFATAPRSRISLRQLEAFCTVMTAGGASAAARRLARTQSAVSTAVAELEATLGEALFERAGRGLRPTDAARRLLPHALELVERAVELPARATGTATDERLRIGASRTIGPFVMPALLARFAAERPAAQVELSVGNTAGQIARLRRFELDVAFVEGDVHEPGLEVRAWTEDAL